MAAHPHVATLMHTLYAGSGASAGDAAAHRAGIQPGTVRAAPSYGRRLGTALVPWLVPALTALLWYLASRQQWMSPQILPSPELVAKTALELASGELGGQLWISVQRLALGLLGGVSTGLLLGAVLGASARAERLIYPTFSALAQVPTLAWIPLFMLFFGIGELLKWVVLVKAIVVPVTVHTLVGARDVPPRLREAAAVLRLPRGVRLWRLTVPAALPSVLTGLRLALSQGWAALLAVELLASSEGIGYLMVWGRQLFMLDIVLVCILVVGLTGGVMAWAMHRLSQRMVHWPQPGMAAFAGGRAAPGGWGVQSWALPLVLLAVWQLASQHGGAARILAAPLAVLHTTASGLLDGSLPTAMALSLGRTLGGLALGGGSGVLLGLALGLWRPAERALGPALAAVRQVAIFAWVPLLTAWFGLGEPAKVVFVALAAFFPLLLATRHGVADLSPQLAEAAGVLRLNLRQRLRLLILPGALPAIFAGLRLGLIYAWLGTVGAEYFMPSGGGIGSLLIGAQQLFRMDLVLSGMLLIGLTGAALGALGQLLERRSTYWRHA